MCVIRERVWYYWCKISIPRQQTNKQTTRLIVFTVFLVSRSQRHISSLSQFVFLTCTQLFLFSKLHQHLDHLFNLSLPHVAIFSSAKMLVVIIEFFLVRGLQRILCQHWICLLRTHILCIVPPYVCIRSCRRSSCCVSYLHGSVLHLEWSPFASFAYYFVEIRRQQSQSHRN